MKRIKYFFITAIATILFCSNAGAQHVHIGVKGGANLFNVHNESGFQYDYKLGFHAGLMTHIHFTKHFAIQPEVIYSRQGARFDYLNDDARLILHYVNVPVLFQYMLGNGLRFEAGPQIGFLANSTLRNDDYYYGTAGTFNTVDFAGAVGVSYVTKPGFGIDGRYVHGFTDITDGGVKSTNRGFQLGLFYLFNHK